VPFELRDVRTDDPTSVEPDSAGASTSMTRATDIEQRASEWLIRSEGEEFTGSERADMQRWLQEPRNRVIFLRLQAAWRRASRLRRARPLDRNVDPDLLENTDLTCRLPDNTGKSGWPVRIAAGAAATLIIYLIGLAGWIVLRPSHWIPYSTGIGGYENIELADGSDIQLNTDTQIRTRLTARAREIQLVRGEAMFKIATDRQRPFTIQAANIAVRVNQLGGKSAALVVRLRAPNAIDVSVTRGSAVLEPAEHWWDLGFRRSAAATSTIVEGDLAAIRPQGMHLTRVGLEELNRKLSWTVGLLFFQGETLTEVTDEFNRYNRKHLIVADPAIAGRRIGGAFQATDPDSFVSALRMGFGVRADELRQANSDYGVIRLTSAR